jgi:restriction system protein
MTIPGYQAFMLPLLKITSDQSIHAISEIHEKLADFFLLTETDRQERLPSGRQLKFENRIHWAKTFLQKAGLLEPTGRGKFRITARGLIVLKDNPQEISDKYLSRFPEFAEFRKREGHTEKHDEEPINSIKETPVRTPIELLEESYQNLRQALAQEIIETIHSCRPKFFENLVVDLLIAMGYGGSRKDTGAAIGRTGDGGVDGIIKEDRLGLDIVYIQAKRWTNTVSAPDVQAFAGSLEGFRARKGVMITTSKFSPKAHEYVEKIEKKIVLIDGEQLAQLMIDFGIGVTEVDHYVVKRLDLDYFDEEA